MPNVDVEADFYGPIQTTLLRPVTDGCTQKIGNCTYLNYRRALRHFAFAVDWD